MQGNLACFLYSSQVPVWTPLYAPLFLLFLCAFLECLCPLLWSPGGTGRTEPLFYISKLHLSYIILVVVRSIDNLNRYLLSLLYPSYRILLQGCLIVPLRKKRQPKLRPLALSVNFWYIVSSEQRNGKLDRKNYDLGGM